MRKVTVAAVQMACVPDAAENRRTAETMVRRAAATAHRSFCCPNCSKTLISARNAAMRPMTWRPRRQKIRRFSSCVGWLRN